MKPLCILLIALILASCTYDNQEDLGVIPLGSISEPIDFSTTIRPIINSDCAVSGCHESGATALPDFSGDDRVLELASSIRDAVFEARMPKGRTMSFEKRNLIVSWADQHLDSNSN